MIKLLLDEVVSSSTSVEKTIEVDPRVRAGNRDEFPCQAVLSRVSERYPLSLVQVSVKPEIHSPTEKLITHNTFAQ